MRQRLQTKGRLSQWDHTDFFNHRVKIGVILRHQRAIITPVITAEIKIVDEQGNLSIQHFGPQVGDLSFDFWAGDREGGAHEPKIRWYSDVPNSVDFGWRVLGREISRKSYSLDGEYYFPSTRDITLPHSR